LESFPKAGDKWADLATAMFPQGSYGNGSAMRVAPVGLFLHNDLQGILATARTSSVVTFEKAVEAAVFLGGDTDTIASMTGAIIGAALGESHIPARWIQRTKETVYVPQRIREIARNLYRKGLNQNFRRR
jgi:ADP-ribosylglycohydrolase